jgi:glycosyl transferase family 9 (putative heptosyltransferase)
VAILLGGGVREALLAQPILRACEGATVFATEEAVGALLGIPSIGRTVVLDDSPAELVRLFVLLRTGPITTVVLPMPARLVHAAMAYFAGVPRRLMLPGPNQWAASERLTGVEGSHPIDANRRLAAAAADGRRPMLAGDDLPSLQPPDPVRVRVINRWPAFIAGGRRPLVLVPGGGNWHRARRSLWPSERFSVVANQSTAERIILLNGVGDERAVRETRSGIAKPTTVINLDELTVDEVAVLCEHSLAVVGHDGDALHTAAAAGAIVVPVARKGDILPLGDRVTTLWVDDFEHLPARPVVDAVAKQARIDTYA